MRLARWATLGVGALCAVVGFVGYDVEGLLASVFATVIVFGFFATGIIPLVFARKPDTPRGASVGMLIFTYSTRLILVVVGLILLASASFVHDRWMVVTIIATAVAWTSAQFVHVIRSAKREPTIEPEQPH